MFTGMQVWIGRLSLALAGLITLMLALSFPSPRDATPLSIAIQAICFLVSVTSFVALFRIGRTDKRGWRLVALLGLAAPFMLAFNARGILNGFRPEAPFSPAVGLLLSLPWIALLIAAACSIRRQSDAGESTATTRREDEDSHLHGEIG
ncbi:MAG TPA: hypothetical protein VF179_19565 [Thermoanaerobaculia bacterium]|nr:hypothetical protein [Thermoanaerobaculia bacterium]